MEKINLFIVGAPKCGTTALNNYLSQHSDICMASKKEMHYFATDLEHPSHVRDFDKYKSYFKHYNNHKIIGEASVNYLYSKTASLEIKQYNPDAKIIIMLRSPIEMIPSLHSQLLWNGTESEKNLLTCLQLETERAQGKYLPTKNTPIYEVLYVNRALYYKQVERYFNAFNKNQLHIILYDDFKKDPQKELKLVFDFLEVDNQVSIETSVINPNKQVKHKFIQSLLKSDFLFKKVLKYLIPNHIKETLIDFIKKNNTVYKKRDPLNQEIIDFIYNNTKEDINYLFKLIEKDVRWL